MTEPITYLPEVECDVTAPESVHGTQVVAVTDDEGRRHHVRTAKGATRLRGDRHYLPIGIVHVDRKRRAALIELPSEAGSGFQRLWVAFDHFLPERTDGP